MKIKIVLLFLILFLRINLEAQPEIESPLNQQNIDTEQKMKHKLGIKFSLGTHWFTGTEFNSIGGRPKLGVGVGLFQFINLDKNKNKQLQWEVCFNQKGSRFDFNTNDTSFSNISITYLEVPVLFAYKVFKKENVFLLAGAQANMNVKSSIKQGFGKFGDIKVNKLPLKQFDFQAQFGIRKTLSYYVSIQLVYKKGLYNINTSKFTSGIINSTYPDIVPALTGRGTIMNNSIELSFLF